MTAEDFRRIALEMQGAIEGAHMGHPDFRAHGRIFATLHSDDQMGMVKVSPEEQQVLIDEHPAVFTPSSGAWGRQGCTNVRLDEAEPKSVRGAMLLAWQLAVSRPPSKPSAKSRRKTGPKPMPSRVRGR